jgi:hypothetical protein
MGFERDYKSKLMVFERKVLRRIFGPTKKWYMKNQNKG